MLLDRKEFTSFSALVPELVRSRAFMWKRCS